MFIDVFVDHPLNMSHRSFSMGTLPIVLPKKIFSTRSDGTNFRDGIISRRRPNLSLHALSNLVYLDIRKLYIER